MKLDLSQLWLATKNNAVSSQVIYLRGRNDIGFSPIGGPNICDLYRNVTD